MTVSLEALVALDASTTPVADERPYGVDMMDELIASHRSVILELAPHQEERAARVETGWHIDHLGHVLRMREGEEDQSRHRPS